MRCALISLAVILVSSPAMAQLATPNEAGISFAHVHLNVADIELHKTLWTELFDGELLDMAGRAVIRIPGAFVFLTDRAPTARSVGTAVNHIGFKVRDIEAVLAEWRAMGYEVDNEFMGGEGLPQAYITMPNGTRVELAGDPEIPGMSEMHHVHFYSPRNKEMLAWYLDLLGGTARARGTIQDTMDVPGSNLSFSEAAEEVSATQGTAVDHVGIEVEDLDAFAELLRSKGVELQVEPRHVEALDVWIAFFVDPAGARVEVSQGLARY